MLQDYGFGLFVNYSLASKLITANLNFLTNNYLVPFQIFDLTHHSVILAFYIVQLFLVTLQFFTTLVATQI